MLYDSMRHEYSGLMLLEEQSVNIELEECLWPR